MDFDYVESAQDALELLTEFGGAEPGLTFTHTPKGGYVPGHGGGASGAPVVTQAVGLIFAYTDAGGTTRGGSQIQAGDQKAYVAALDASGAAIPAPAATDKCTTPANVTYSVVNVDTLAPSGQTVLYEIQLRR